MLLNKVYSRTSCCGQFISISFHILQDSLAVSHFLCTFRSPDLPSSDRFGPNHTPLNGSIITMITMRPRYHGKTDVWRKGMIFNQYYSDRLYASKFPTTIHLILPLSY
jgi:hypothetical protein